MNFARKEKFIVWESSCFDLFADEKYGLFLIQKFDVRWYSSVWNTMFFEYQKVFVLNFLKIGNTVSFWSKNLMESWYFLYIFELFMIFQDLENMVFHAVIFALILYTFFNMYYTSWIINNNMQKRIIQTQNILIKYPVSIWIYNC